MVLSQVGMGYQPGWQNTALVSMMKGQVMGGHSPNWQEARVQELRKNVMTQSHRVNHWQHQTNLTGISKVPATGLFVNQE